MYHECMIWFILYTIPTWMNAKKILGLTITSWLALSFLSTSALAQSDDDVNLDQFFESLNEWSSFGFTEDSAISVSETWPTSATITFDVVTDPSDDKPVFSYKVTYSDDEAGVLAGGFDSIDSKVFNLLDTNGGEVSYDADAWVGMVTLMWLTPSSDYSFYIEPVNASNVEWEASSEMAFSTNSQEWGVFEDGDELLWAAWIALQNITHQQNDREVTVMWDPIEGWYTVQVSMKAVTEIDWSSLGSATGESGKFGPIAIDAIGLYNLDLVLFDSDWNRAWPSKRYTLKIDTLQWEIAPSQAAWTNQWTTTQWWTTTNTTNTTNVNNVTNTTNTTTKTNATHTSNGKVVKSTPQVWPTQNIVFAFLILSVLFYVMLRYRKIK